MRTEKIELEENLYLVDSVFGWILSGKPNEGKNDELTVLTYFQTSYGNKLNKPDPPLDMGSVKNLWELESIGITDSPNSNRDEEAIKTFNETTVVEDNRYVVSWPWNEYPPDLPSNFGLAYGRLVSLLNRMDKETLVVYEQTLKDQVDKGVIEIVPNNVEVDHPVHFLAHHGISAPGKALRIVYDASAKVKDNKSLNECLYRGPIMLEDLTGLLIKFRCHKIGMTADVEKAFLQVGLHDKDRDVTRFLWIKDISKPATKENLIIYRFTRVPFGIISSPYLLNATIRHHLMNSDSEHMRKLANDIYVDNLLTGANNIQEATQIYEDCKSTFKQISMNIREWNSNCKDLKNIITDCNKDDTVKTLGLDWNLNKDTLQMKVKLKNNAFTKRGLLKTIASIYDPCGFAAPIVLPAKLLLQSLWKENKKWDSPVSNEVTEKWEIILKDLDTVKDICLPRLMSNNKDCELHCFTDASVVAYSAVVYLLQENNLKFVIGKSRLTPIKDQENLKIARLELLGVVIGNRLLQYVAKYLPIKVTKQVLWCDSQIVLSWYKSNKLLVPFVARRIEEIKRNKDLDMRYIPSTLNPADVATRPLKSKEELTKWLNGPAFLLQDPTTWPSSPVVENTLLTREGLSNHNTQASEEKITELASEKEIVTSNKEDIMTEISDKDHLAQTNINNKIKSEVQEIIKVQKQYFPEESGGKRTHLTRNLGLFTDIDGVLRSEGRLTHSDLSYETKHPILLPKNCEFTNKVIKRIHEENYHVGVPHTLSKVRQRFWIPQGRAQVQKIINKCPQCVKHGGGAYTLPNTPALPPERVKYETPFTYVGMDYFGPMVVKSDKSQEKRWVCLFTCLVVRAIHLEIVKDMSTDECSLAFRRFVAARGTPSIIVSDNALQFKLLSEVVTGINSSSKGVQWKFIPQLAPWHGGVYERLVAIVKHCLKRTLEKHLLGDNQLLTIIKEVQAIVNTRPLTYVGNDQGHILKPADFLTPGRCINIDNLEERISSSSTSTKQQLLEGWKRGEMIMNEYKDMFINQYLLGLRERYNHSPKQARVKAKIAPCIGDIVQIKGESKNRGNWKVGRITELLKGIDGLCRVAKVKVGEAIFTRSIAHLYPLEAEESLLSEDLMKDQSCIKQSLNSPYGSNNLDQELSLKIREPMISSENEIDRAIINEMDVTKHKEVMDDTERHEDIDMLNDDEIMDGSDEISHMDISDEMIESSTEVNEVMEDHEQKEIQEESMTGKGNHKRAAAVQAMKRIKDWTRHLMLTLTQH
ncbi:uncharacterized protein LOC134745317 [Cydia strobilella]|uniref:uncharacterized protein LOC134745317 n=1 Tax=Cydia strobilella TaxID=1100964 RepID=UPI00300438D1